MPGLKAKDQGQETQKSHLDNQENVEWQRGRGPIAIVVHVNLGIESCGESKDREREKAGEAIKIF